MSAQYASTGSLIGLGIGVRSHNKAWRSSPAVQRWQEEWGAQANAFTLWVWANSSATFKRIVKTKEEEKRGRNRGEKREKKREKKRREREKCGCETHRRKWYRHGRGSNIQNNYLLQLHHKGRHVIVIVLIPT